MSAIPIDPKLAHLSADELDLLISRYYKKLPIKSLLNEYRIDCKPLQLISMLPPIISSEACPNCGEAMLQPRLPRTTITKKRKKYSLHCSICKHRNEWCDCNHCRQKREEINNSANYRFKAAISSRNKVRGIQASDLSLSQAVSLLALRMCYVPSNTKSTVLQNQFKFSNAPFAPHGSYSDGLICDLEDSGLIIQSTQPNYAGFSIPSSPFSNAYLQKYVFSKQVTPELLEELDEIISTRNWPTQWFDQLFDVANNLAVAECKEFFYLCSSERKLPRINEKTVESMLKNLLEDFTTGQSFQIIQRGAQYTSDFLVKHAATPSAGAKFMVDSCQRFTNKARKEDWIIRPLPRNSECPRSMFSKELYDFILSLKNKDIDTIIPLIHFPI